MKNRRKIILYIATSLDGYIARENGDIDWLPEVENQDFGYYEFLRTVDTIVMGKRTYDQVLTFGDFPYIHKKCYVFSSSHTGKDKYVEFINSSAKDFVDKLNEEAGGDIWLVGGADLVNSFMKNNLIDELIVSIIPIILGKGIRLFDNNNPETRLQLVESTSYSEGIVQIYYSKL
ncbi:MAG: dihydrofolate reductase family protein [Bacillota bacterium]|nr:dihydrofolate reductase family protein [Bacillota bacterium]